MAAPILFTAFEPSGDQLAAHLIAELKRRQPDRALFAMGGPQMADAGAELIDVTTEQAVMGAGAVRHVAMHRRRLKRLTQWMATGPKFAAVVPTDSPAANWAVCRLTRRVHPKTKIVHLAAPQLWAWAPWRLRKLKLLTDHLLCLLPFEQQWFAVRGVSATFVGHPIFEQSAPGDPPLKPWSEQAADFHGTKLAVLPGSRPAEIDHNYRAMLTAVERLRRDAGHEICAVVVASDKQRATQIETLTPRDEQVNRGIHTGHPVWVTTAAIEQVLQWADLALVVSGTATLLVAQHRTPMVTLYYVNWWNWHLAGRYLVQTRTFTLPNLIGESLGIGRVVPELVPYFGNVGALTAALEPLLAAGTARKEQQAGFAHIAQAFADRKFSQVAADTLLEVIAE